MALTEQKKRFVERYFETLKGAQSAIDVGYSEATAKQIAYNLLQEPEVDQYLQELRNKLSAKHGVTQDRIIEEYAKIAFFDIREIYDVDGGLIHVKQLDDKSAGAIASIKSTEEWGEDDEGNKVVIGTNKEVKLFDKIRALQDLGKHLGLFEKDNSQKKPETPSLTVTIARPTDTDE